MNAPLNRPDRPAFKVIDGNPAYANQTQRPHPDDGYPFILPAIKTREVLPWAIAYDVMGLKRGQVRLAFKAVMSTRGDGEIPRYIECLDRIVAAKRETALALQALQRETLAILLEHYPAAARRIMRAAGKGRRASK
jgi:hypothetical protein